MEENVHQFWSTVLADLETAHAKLADCAASALFYQQALGHAAREEGRPLRLGLLLVLRALLEDSWAGLPEDELKNEVREQIFSLLLEVHSEDKPLWAAGALLACVVERDGIDSWEEPLGQLVSWMDSDEERAAVAGTRVLLQVLQRVEEAGPRLAKTLLPCLFQQFAKDYSEQTRALILSLTHAVLKSLAATDSQETVKEGLEGSYELWMSLFSSVLQSSVEKHISLKREVVKCLVVVFRDLGCYLQRSVSQLNSIWSFINQLLPLFGWTVIWGLPASDFRPGPPDCWGKGQPLEPFLVDEEDLLLPDEQLQALVYQAVEFISTIVATPALSSLVKLTIYQIVSLLAHFSIQPRATQAQSQADELCFLQHEGEEELGSSLRVRCLNVINDLIERFGSLAILTVLVVSEHMYFNFSPEKIDEYCQDMARSLLSATKVLPDFDEARLLQLFRGSFLSHPHPEFAGMKRETAVLLLGRFNDDIIVFQTKGQGPNMLTILWALLKKLEKSSSWERGTSIWCLSKYVELVALKAKDMFEPVLLALWTRLSLERSSPIKTVCLKAISCYSRKMYKLKLPCEPLAKQFFEGALSGLVDLRTESPTVVGMQVECLLEFVSLAPWAKKELQKHSPFLQSCFALHSKEGHVFSSIQALLRKWEDGEAFSAMEAGWWELLDMCFTHFLAKDDNFRSSPEQCDFISKCLTLQELLILKSAHLERRCKGCFLRLQALVMASLSNDVATKASVCLKAFLRRDSSLIERLGLGSALKEVIVKLLEVPTDKSLEGSALYVGNLIVLTFEKVLGQPDPSILQLVVNKVFRSRTPSVIQSLVLVFAHLVNRHSPSEDPFELDRAKVGELVSFLCSFNVDNRIGLKVLVDKWLLQQSLFRGRLTKNATYLALARLFLLQEKTLDSLLVIGFNPSHSNISSVQAPLKIVSTLVRCLDHICGKGPELEEEREEGREEQIEVGLSKFRDEQGEEEVVRGKGGLAELEGNGSTCYMSAMLQFFDDGEECDESTEEDLEHLGLRYYSFELGGMLKAFFGRLQQDGEEHWRLVLRGLLREDTLLLKRCMKLK